MAGIAPVAWRELRRRFEGQILAPDDSGYDDARRVWNAMVDKRPAVIAKCNGREDVAAAVAFARQTGLEVAVRGGGHSVSGSSSTEGGIVIDLTPMRTVTVDPQARVARVGGGALLRHMDSETQRFGLATTGGMVSHTGVSGLTLGGGYGYLARRFGLACDNLLAAEVVLADGTITVVSESSEPDLFWGLRGGGGNFGVVTWFEFRLHPVGPTVLSAGFTFSADDGPAVLRAFRDLVFARQDIALDTYTGAVSRSWAGVDEALAGRPVVTVDFTVTCPDLDDGEVVAASLRSVAPPLTEILEPVSYVALQSAGDASWAPGVSHCYWKSSAFSELPDGLLDAFVERGVESASVAEGCGLEMVAAFGGAVSQVGEDDTSDAGVYINNLGQEDRVREAYGEAKYQRLVALKDRFDPENLFRLNANIRPSTNERRKPEGNG